MSANIYDPITKTLTPYAGNGQGGATNLSGLTDVSLSSISDGQVLTYDATNHVWINANGGTTTIDELGDISDVDLTNLTDGQVIAWDDTNSKWVNVNLPTIPTKVSDLTNDSGFITNAVNNLVNYYLKSETYTKTEVDGLISAIENVSFEVVNALPTTDIETNVIYLVPSTDASTGNVKDEYIYISGAWELIGSTAIDLSDYITETELNAALADYTTTANLTILLNAKQDIIQVTSFPTANADNAGRIVQYIGESSSTNVQGYFYRCNQYVDPNPGGINFYMWDQIDVQPNADTSEARTRAKLGAHNLLNANPLSVTIDSGTESTEYIGSMYLNSGDSIIYSLKRENSGSPTSTYGHKLCIKTPSNVVVEGSSTTKVGTSSLSYTATESGTFQFGVYGHATTTDVQFSEFMVRLSTDIDTVYEPYCKTNQELSQGLNDCINVISVNGVSQTITDGAVNLDTASNLITEDQWTSISSILS